MKRPFLVLPFLLGACLAASAPVAWRSLPDLPQALGGQFVGTVAGRLVVAGGSSWDRPPWAQGTKSWADTVYVLDVDGRAWRAAGRLPQPLAYGVSLDVPQGMLLLGGQTRDGFSDAVVLVSLREGKAEARTLGRLPEARGMMNGALLDGVVYLAGGQTATPGKASPDFLSIPLADLLAGRAAWKRLASWPGPPRFFSHLAACAGALYLAAGTDLAPGPDAQPVRVFLDDLYRFTPRAGWEKLPNLPHPTQAGLAACSQGRFHIFGGNDNTRSEALRDQHPGFQLDVLRFDPAARAWSVAGQVPTSLVTTGIASWRGEFVIAGGEDRPGHRSAKVVAARIP